MISKDKKIQSLSDQVCKKTSRPIPFNYQTVANSVFNTKKFGTNNFNTKIGQPRFWHFYVNELTIQTIPQNVSEFEVDTVKNGLFWVILSLN